MYKAVFALLVCFSAMLGTCFSQTEETQKMDSNHPIVVLTTNFGDITLELDAEKAPKTVENFVQYVKDGQYDHTIFHRVIENFMIQGGGFTADMSQKSVRASVVNEADNGLKNQRGSIAMARTSDPHSASAQFFINTVDNPFLNFKAKNDREYGYAVFGKVIDGMDVVDKIKKVKTGSKNGHQDVPTENVEIIKATLKQ